MAETNKEYVRNTDWKFDNELEETISVWCYEILKAVKF